MKRTVAKLKKKHRDSIWRDEEGDFWYWDTIQETWAVLMSDSEGGFHVNPNFDPSYYHKFERVASSLFARARVRI